VSVRVVQEVDPQIARMIGSCASKAPPIAAFGGF